MSATSVLPRAIACWVSRTWPRESYSVSLVRYLPLGCSSCRYLLPVLPFACLAAGLAFAPARVGPAPEAAPGHEPDGGGAEPPPVRILENGVVADDLVLSLGEARRLAVRSQHLAGPPPAAGIDGMRQVLRGLRVLQLDPVNVVARSHLLVLWSRLGGFDRNDLDALLWRERWLFEYWAHAASIVLIEDYPIHRVMMRAYSTIENKPMREWLAANEEFRRYVLDRLRDAGPLLGEAIEDRSAVSWVSTGWTNGRNVDRMLDILWKQGVIMVAGRDGLRRLWGLADLPAAADLPREEMVTRAAGHALRALGVARARDVERHFTIGRYPGLDLERMDWARPVRVEGGSEQWWVHRDTLGLLDEEWRPSVSRCCHRSTT
ncbi:MAG: DNA glycosylase AlkZ-like family protein [Streptosporangiaceae bacterium]